MKRITIFLVIAALPEFLHTKVVCTSGLYRFCVIWKTTYPCAKHKPNFKKFSKSFTNCHASSENVPNEILDEAMVVCNYFWPMLARLPATLMYWLLDLTAKRRQICAESLKRPSSVQLQLLCKGNNSKWWDVLFFTQHKALRQLYYILHPHMLLHTSPKHFDAAKVTCKI